jgi:hypothetical protein
MRYPVINFAFIGICFGVRLRDTLGDNLGIAFLVAGKLAIRTLHTGGIFEEISTKRAAHDVVKLLLHKLVAILFMNFFLLLSNCTLSA